MTGTIFYKIRWKIWLLILYALAMASGASECLAQHDGRKKISKPLQLERINGVLGFQKLFEFEDASSADLYTAAREWVVLTFNSSGDVLKKDVENALIQVEGAEPGIVLFDFPRLLGSLKYTLNITFEENRLCFTMFRMEVFEEEDKYSFESYIYEKDGTEIFNKPTQRVKDHTTKIFKVLINSLETFFAEKSIERR